MNNEKYGIELAMDLMCLNTKLFNYTGIKIFCLELCELLETDPVGFSYIDSDPDDAKNPKTHGFSACQFIVASSITMHGLDLVPGKGALFINVFSCKEFDEEEILEFCKKYFSVIEVVETNRIERIW